MQNTKETYGKNFLAGYDVDGVPAGVIFGHPEMLKELEKHREIALDATFKIVPRLFYQMMTIHIFIEDKAFPVLLALMASKSRKHQDALFRKIKELFPNFKPKWGMADHEKAPRSSAETIFEDFKSKKPLLLFIKYIN